MVDVYIGFFNNTEQKFDYNGDSNIGNIPKRESPFFPFAYDFSKLINMKIRKKEYEGKKVDYAAFVAKVNKKELLDLINEVELERKPFMDITKSDYGFDELKSFVESLSHSDIYALTSMEL